MTEVTAIARLKIHEGRFEEFKRLAVLCVHLVQTKDSGTLQYDYFFNDDHTECVVFERYRDFAAMREHLANIGDELMQALLKVCSMSGDIFATPTPELRKAHAAFFIETASDSKYTADGTSGTSTRRARCRASGPCHPC